MKILTLALSLLAACGGPAPDVQPAAAAPGGTCDASTPCPEGQTCQGPEGCDAPWTCAPARSCTKDIAEYCSCAGETVLGSGSCPPEPYRHRGPCE